MMWYISIQIWKYEENNLNKIKKIYCYSNLKYKNYLLKWYNNLWFAYFYKSRKLYIWSPNGYDLLKNNITKT